MLIRRHSLAATALALALMLALGACNSTPPLLRAMESGDLERITELAAQADSAPYRSRALRMAVEREDLQTATVLLDSGEFDLQDSTEDAAGQGQLEMLGLLLEHGAEPSTEILLVAVEAEQSTCWALLLERGAQPDEGVLEATVSQGELQMLTTMLDAGAPVSDRSVLLAAASARVDLTQLLLDRGGSPDAHQVGGLLVIKTYSNGYSTEFVPTAEGFHALSVAIAAQSTDLVRLLLERGADPNTLFVPRAAPARGGWRIQMTQSFSDGSSIEQDGPITRVIGKGGPPEEELELEQNQVRTPLIYAVRLTEFGDEDRLAIVELLLEHGADPTTQLGTRGTALDEARTLERTEIVSLLEARVQS